MPAESALSGRHFQEGIGREPATEMERSGIEVRSTASVREAGARDRDGAKRNRGAQHGVRQGSGSPRPRWSEAESRCAAVDVFAGKKVPENKKEEKQ